jgi:hypothetical protein
LNSKVRFIEEMLSEDNDDIDNVVDHGSGVYEDVGATGGESIHSHERLLERKHSPCFDSSVSPLSGDGSRAEFKTAIIALFSVEDAWTSQNGT